MSLSDIFVIQKHTYARYMIFTDLHGHCEQLKTAINHFNFGLKDCVFICGDILDRGDEVVPLFDFISNCNRQNNLGGNFPKIIMTLGNHELMFLSWVFCSTLTPSPNLFPADLRPISLSLTDQEWSLLQEKLKRMHIIPEALTIFKERFFSNRTENAVCYKYNASKWLLSASADKLAEMFTYFVTLPIIVRVQETNELGSFNMVHADLPTTCFHPNCNIQDFVFASPNFRYDAVWLRADDSDPTISTVRRCDGRGETYCGHSFCDGLGIKESIGYYNLDFATFFTKTVAFVLIHGSQKSFGFVEEDNGKMCISSFYGQLKHPSTEEEFNECLYDKKTFLALSLMPATGACSYTNISRIEPNLNKLLPIVTPILRVIAGELQKFTDLVQSRCISKPSPVTQKILNLLNIYFDPNTKANEKIQLIYRAYILFKSNSFTEEINTLSHRVHSSAPSNLCSPMLHKTVSFPSLDLLNIDAEEDSLDEVLAPLSDNKQLSSFPWHGNNIAAAEEDYLDEAPEPPSGDEQLSSSPLTKNSLFCSAARIDASYKPNCQLIEGKFNIIFHILDARNMQLTLHQFGQVHPRSMSIS